MRLHLWAEFQNYKLRYTNVFCIPLTSLEVLALGHLARLTMSFRLLTYWRLTIDHLQHSGMALQTSMVSLIPINTCSKVIPTDNFTNLHKPFNVCKQLMWLNCKWLKETFQTEAILFPKTFEQTYCNLPASNPTSVNSTSLKVSGEWYSKSEDHNSKEFGPRFLWDGRIGCLLKGSDTTIPKKPFQSTYLSTY